MEDSCNSSKFWTNTTSGSTRKIGVNSLHYLGYSIDGNGIHPNLERIAAVQKAPKPSNSKEMQYFLSFAQYYSKFVKNFALKARPLFDMLSTEFIWPKESEMAYDSLLHAIVNGEVLACFQLGLPSQLIVDASEEAIGAVLEQDGRPILCISRSLSSAEKTIRKHNVKHWPSSGQSEDCTNSCTATNLRYIWTIRRYSISSIPVPLLEKLRQPCCNGGLLI